MNLLLRAAYARRWLKSSALAYAKAAGAQRVNSYRRKRAELDLQRERDREPAREFLDDGREVLYEGPLMEKIKGVKTMSLVSCVATSMLGPYIMLTRDELSRQSDLQQITIGFLVFAIGAGTTGFLSWVCSPYISRLSLSPDKKVFIAEQTDFLLRQKVTAFRVGSQTPVDILRPMVNFEAEKRHYFLAKENMKHKMVREQFPWIVKEDDE